MLSFLFKLLNSQLTLKQWPKIICKKNSCKNTILITKKKPKSKYVFQSNIFFVKVSFLKLYTLLYLMFIHSINLDKVCTNISSVSSWIDYLNKKSKKLLLESYYSSVS